MAIPFHKAVTSPEAIGGSIRTDRYVYRWFSFLIIQPAIKEKLKKIPGSEEHFEVLRKLTKLQILIYVVILLNLYALLASYQLLLMVPILALNYITLKYSRLKKDRTAKISLGILLKDYSEEELCQMTLYKISEIYARELNIPSLVDTIYTLDRTMRRTIMWTFVITCYVYPLKFSQVFLWLATTFFMVRLIANLNYFYRQYK